ncbi:hypothetical protein [Tahibacter soli]|uniref:Uncharacterized protein n=1 Tax=Tahibacter soli TaxID=2983605 RepID=A0A9X4BIU9_9GAMM|nr:hypothetical protein [Tahibacter soli]MDC8012597.1 hypothetical protein [Tahibacter soli]
MDAYTDAVLSVESFVRFHIQLAPFLLHRLRAAANVSRIPVVVELSSLYAHALQPDESRTLVGVDLELHVARVSKALAIDCDLAQQLCWTYRLAELQLRPSYPVMTAIDLASTGEWMRRLE